MKQFYKIQHERKNSMVSCHRWWNKTVFSATMEVNEALKEQCKYELHEEYPASREDMSRKWRHFQMDHGWKWKQNQMISGRTYGVLWSQRPRIWDKNECFKKRKRGVIYGYLSWSDIDGPSEHGIIYLCSWRMKVNERADCRTHCSLPSPIERTDWWRACS